MFGEGGDPAPATPAGPAAPSTIAIAIAHAHRRAIRAPPNDAFAPKAATLCGFEVRREPVAPSVRGGDRAVALQAQLLADLEVVAAHQRADAAVAEGVEDRDAGVDPALPAERAQADERDDLPLVLHRRDDVGVERLPAP